MTAWDRLLAWLADEQPRPTRPDAALQRTFAADLALYRAAHHAQQETDSHGR